jgi:hypothetical protein
MAEFQWWLLLVGLVAGGGLVAVVSMDGRRREEDLDALERRAEATWIADRLGARDRDLDAATVEAVLRVHREYLGLPPPDRFLLDDEVIDETGGRPGTASSAVAAGVALADGDADRDPD